MDVDDATGIVGVALGAAVGLAAVKMTTDMVSDLEGPQKKKCRKCGKIKSRCKCKAKMDYGGDLFKMESWRNL